MKKTHIETKSLTQEVIDDILCNQCGESCQDESGMNFEGLIETNVCGGYSSLLGDSIRYTFSLCERCLEQLFRGFQIATEIDRSGYLGGGICE